MGVLREDGRRIRLADVYKVDAVQRHATLSDGRLGRANVHPAIDLHRVGGNHLAAQAQAQGIGKRGLSACRGTDDRYDPIGTHDT